MKFGTIRWLKVAAVAGMLFVLLVSSAAAAKEDRDPLLNYELAQLRQATAKYHDLDAALADGFFLDETCTASPMGGMGYHAINLAAFMDPAIDPFQPEGLLYAKIGNQFHLVGVEWLTPDVGQPHPEVFGVPFDGPMPGHFEGMPTHYDLHAWIWLPNPNGVFAQWNPRVTCN